MEFNCRNEVRQRLCYAGEGWDIDAEKAHYESDWIMDLWEYRLRVRYGEDKDTETEEEKGEVILLRNDKPDVGVMMVKMVNSEVKQLMSGYTVECIVAWKNGYVSDDWMKAITFIKGVKIT